MFRIVQQTSSAAAKHYYQAADYYTEGPERTGQWGGLGADRLGLYGEVAKDYFDALCENKNPITGEALTPRTRSNRRVGYDFNFHVPKSVSILYGLNNDAEILEAFRASVQGTMNELEADARTRVRKGGKEEDRVTGNLVWAEYIHTTSRPVDGVPDPHLHAHCFVFNATHDQTEQQWKAMTPVTVKQDAPYYEAVFHARLANRLQDLGYGIERTAKGWEVAGVPKSLIKDFSRRTTQIEALAASMGITDAKQKDTLGAKTREAKQHTHTASELRSQWQSRLTDNDRAALDEVMSRPLVLQVAGRSAARDAMAYAVEHCFERDSVVPERTLLATALKRGVGSVTADEVRKAMSDHDIIRHELGGRSLVTTRDIVREEQGMLAFARNGRGKCPALGKRNQPLSRDWLDAEQRAAVQHVLRSPDRVMVIRGVAGAGKTSLMQEAIEGIEANGHTVLTLAPSADASRGVLRSEGFAAADTVARFLLDERMQESAHGQVLWIDEAGLLGTRTLAKLFTVADKLEARVILSGDNRQHSSVERGDALRLLETQAGVTPVEARDIKRQKGDYKRAVADLAEGRVAGGFDRLNALGWVQDLPDQEREQRLAADYVETVQQGKSALVVSPTHAEGHRVTAAIREALHHQQLIGDGEQSLPTLHRLNLTTAEQSDPLQYEAGMVIEFQQNAKGFRRGARLTVSNVRPDGVTVRDATGYEQALPLNFAERFQVFRPSELAVAIGDRLRVTKNGFTADQKHRLDNGAMHTVKGFAANGNMVLDNGWVVGREYGHLAYGYCITSHASQGKTVDRVFVAQSSDSFPASSREQFYVSASRARERLTVYTDDKMALRAAIQHSEPRMSATELVKSRRLLRDRMMQHIKRITYHAHQRAAELTQTQSRGMEMGR